jgi:hypothetical protein
MSEELYLSKMFTRKSLMGEKKKHKKIFYQCTPHPKRCAVSRQVSSYNPKAPKMD